MKREWYCDECEQHLLEKRLNTIAQRGGNIFAILDGPITRQHMVMVVWYVEIAVQASAKKKP